MAWRHAVLGCGLLIAACGSPAPPHASPTTPAATPLPAVARPEDTADAFFTAWQRGEYASMYELLSQQAQASTPREVFVRRYTDIHDGVGETNLTIKPTTLVAPDNGLTAHVPFDVTHGLAVFGDLTESNTLALVQEQGAWKVAWQPSLIFAGLTATSKVRLTPEVPVRGRILDRAGKSLAENGAILMVGVIPGEIKDEAALLAALAEATGLPAASIKQRYQAGQPTWFMPIVERAAADRADLEPKLGSIPGVALHDRPARVYPLGEAAAHVVGYVGHPTSNELRQAELAGYDETDWIGRAGIEAWGERRLAGTRGGAIQIVDQGGRVSRNLARRVSEPGEDLQLTLDSKIQVASARALGDKTGSVVVIDPRDNSVLGLVSQPSFDPNQFVVGLSEAEWQQLNGPQRPLVLRATESAYPTGSIFKVITMAAGLEQGGVKPSNTFDCGLDWKGLPGITLHNWESQGTLNLSEALTRSCNPAFFDIGLKLDRLDPSILPGYARAFGLGQPTRTAGVHEVGGTLPDPPWKQQQRRATWTSGDSVNLAIGQGDLLATPLQMANAYAALARGGTLLAPILVVDQARQTLGSVSLSSTTLATILDGMKRVTSTPRGTAYYAFRDEKLQIAAKTGSAENESPEAHAWFVGFTPPEKPSLLVLVMVEGGEHGGTVAAPVARMVIDAAYPLTR